MAESRKFLSVVIASGLDFDMLTPEDVMRHVTMDVLAHHLPADLKADLLSAGLAAKSMTATLVLETLGLEGIAEHVPSSILWNCVAESAGKSLGEPQDAPAEVKASEPVAEPPPVTKAKPEMAATAKTVARKPNRSAQAAPKPEPAPAPAPAPEPAPPPPVAATPTPEPAPDPLPAMSADPPTRVPEPSDPPPARPERMQTLAEPNDYYEADTSVGNEAIIGEVEYVEEISYAEGDEVTAFGQD